MVLGINELNFLCDSFLQTLCSLHDHFFPLKRVKLYSNYHCPWLSDRILLLMKRRDCEYRKGNKPLFLHYRNRVKTEIKKAKSSHLKHLSDLHSKGDWQKIKRLCSQRNNIDHDKWTAEEHNQFIASTYINVTAEFDRDLQHCQHKPILLSVEQVHEELTKVKKGGGLPYLPPWIFSNYADVLANTVTIILNRSLQSGIIPASFKTVPVLPIPKTKNPQSLDEFRPISLVSPVLKILEKFVLKYWLTPIIKEADFHDQFAFILLAGRGCQSAVTLAYGHIVNCLLVFMLTQRL